MQEFCRTKTQDVFKLTGYTLNTDRKFVEPKHRMYLNWIRSRWCWRAVIVEPKHRMYLNSHQ